MNCKSSFRTSNELLLHFYPMAIHAIHEYTIQDEINTQIILYVLNRIYCEYKASYQCFQHFWNTQIFYNHRPVPCLTNLHLVYGLHFKQAKTHNDHIT